MIKRCITLLQEHHDDICDNNAIFHRNIVQIEGNKIPFKRSYDKQNHIQRLE